MSNSMKSRLLGAVFALAGCGFVAWSWHDVHTGRLFSFKMAASGPFFVGMGAFFAIEAPDLPANRVSPLGWILSGAGLAVGLLYAEFLKTGRIPFMG